ncbi:hypothetical protein GQ44DRAFT_457683 [Phaeosphaeriaceae sp. PMI808]|nr:hypothetical protein GQ44DRAFT_457683 [Phaeosphaeriaceae sp. PMI808]
MPPLHCAAPIAILPICHTMNLLWLATIRPILRIDLTSSSGDNWLVKSAHVTPLSHPSLLFTFLSHFSHHFPSTLQDAQLTLSDCQHSYDKQLVIYPVSNFIPSYTPIHQTFWKNRLLYQ